MVPLEPENLILKQLVLLNNDLLSLLGCSEYRNLDSVLANTLKLGDSSQICCVY